MNGTDSDLSMIFDMDGVLLDTEQVAMDCWKRAFADFGYDAPGDVLRSTIGIGLTGTIDICRNAFGDLPYDDIAARRFELADRTMMNGPPVKDGIPELIQTAEHAFRSIAVATSTPLASAEKRLAAAGLLPMFDALICGDMIEHGKPAPDIYLAAADAVGSAPGRCIAVEDSGPGITAALAAGMHAVFVRDLMTPDPGLLNRCTARCESAAELQALLPSLRERF